VLFREEKNQRGGKEVFAKREKRGSQSFRPGKKRRKREASASVCSGEKKGGGKGKGSVAKKRRPILATINAREKGKEACLRFNFRGKEGEVERKVPEGGKKGEKRASISARIPEGKGKKINLAL